MHGVNSYDKLTGYTELHKAVAELDLEYVVLNIQNKADINIHVRGTDYTPLDLLLWNAMFIPNQDPMISPNIVSDIARVLLENGATFKTPLFYWMVNYLVQNKLPNQLATIDKETRESLWMTITLCCYYNRDLNFYQPFLAVHTPDWHIIPDFMVEAIVNAAILKQYNIAIQNGWLNDAERVTSFRQIASKETRQEWERLMDLAQQHCAPLSDEPTELYDRAITMLWAVGKIQSAVRCRIAHNTVETRKNAVTTIQYAMRCKLEANRAKEAKVMDQYVTAAQMLEETFGGKPALKG